MKEECLICKAPLEYLPREEMMECAIYHMHGPEHHVMVGAAPLLEVRNEKGSLYLCP